MANTTKTYRIEIQMDSARDQLADANKKLAEMDLRFEGLDRGSAEAKKLTAEMAKLVREIEGLEKSTADFAGQLDTLKPGSVGALREEIAELEAVFERTVRGTKEQEEALLKLGRAKGELKSLEDSLDALAPKERAAAFVDMANGLAGVVGVSVAAGEALGLSADSAAEYEQKMQTVVAVTSAFEAISKAVNSESRANIKNLLATAKGWLGAGEAATGSGKAARLAIASTGVGLLIIALAYVVTNWEKLTKTVTGSEAGFAKLKATVSGVFDGLVAGIKAGADALVKFTQGDFSAAADAMHGVGKKMAAAYNEGYRASLWEGYQARLLLEAEQADRLIEIAKAKGRDTYAAEREALQKRIVAQKQSNEEEKKQYQDLIKELVILDVNERKKREDAATAATLARLNAVIAIEQAKGEEAFEKQLAAKKTELAALLGAEQQNGAAIIAKRGEIAALTIQHTQQQAEKHRAKLIEAGAQEVALLAAQGKDTLALRVKLAEELAALDTGTGEKQREQRRADINALNLLLAEQTQTEKVIYDEQQQQRADYDALDTEARIAFRGAVSEEGKRLVQEKSALEKQIAGDLGSTILTKYFGVSPEQVAAVKAAITDAVSGVYDGLQQVGAAFMDGATQEADRQLAAVQERLTALDEQLSAATSKRESDEQALLTASGAKRDYLITRINAERAAEQKLLAEKAKAAKEEQTATKEKHRLEKISAQLTAASALATNTAAAATAVFAAIKAVSSGSAVPFPGNLVAIGAGLAAVLVAVASAKQLSNANAYADGGFVTGPGGPREDKIHARLSNGEFVVNAAATFQNRAMLEAINAGADLPYHVLPPTSGREAVGVSGAGFASAASVQALESKIDRTNALLEQMLGHTANTAKATTTTALFGPPVMEFGYDAELKRQRLQKDMADSNQDARL
jgi:hypothetical protein